MEFFESDGCSANEKSSVNTFNRFKVYICTYIKNWSPRHQCLVDAKHSGDEAYYNRWWEIMIGYKID